MATQGVPLWSTTAASNSIADPAVNWAEGMAPSGVNDSGRAMMASVAKWRDDLYGLTTGGTSTAYTVTTNATYASAAAMSGAIFTIIPNATSGASPTLAVDGLTARAINISTGVAVPTGALKSGTPYLVKYVHASTEFIVLGTLDKVLLSALDIITGTSLSSLATDDTLPVYDLSATANRRILISDFLKIVNSLTADASPDRAADYVMTYDASAAAAKKVLLQNLPVAAPRGYISGCILSNGTDTTNDIDISEGVCRDSTNTVTITCAAMAGKQFDANWAPGASAGIRNSAAGIADGTYHVYAVAKADGTQDYYAHTSTTVATVITALQAETGGASYLYARRIGSVIRETGSLVAFKQVGDIFTRSTPLLSTSTAPSTTAALVTLSVPIGLNLVAKINVVLSSSDGLPDLLISSPYQSDQAPSKTAAPGAVLGGRIAGNANTTWDGQFDVLTNTSGQVRWRVNTSSVTAGIMVTVGWSDSRGRDD